MAFPQQVIRYGVSDNPYLLFHPWLKFSNDITHGVVNLGKNNHTATLFSAGGAISTINLFTEGHTAFHVSIIGEKGRVDQTIGYDENPYLSGVRSFCRMFKTGKTDETDETMLMPVAVLEALEKSIVQKRKVKVPSITPNA